MAATLRPALHLLKNLRISGCALPQVSARHPSVCYNLIPASQIDFVRHGSFFNKKDSTRMWDSATGVSNAGRKRGRASRAKLMQKVDLNKGQKVGVGASGYVFPGLSTPFKNVTKLDDLGVHIAEKPDRDLDSKSKIQKKKSFLKFDALDRGFSGKKLPGKMIDPPDPIDGYDFKDFETYIMENKIVSTVTRSQGKVVSNYVTVVTGNKKGLFGIATGKAKTTAAALKNAKNKAAQRLVYIDIYENHTPLHNFTYKHHKTSVIVYQAPKGHGLRCHRALKIMCRLIGIKDIYIKSEGAVRNYLNLCTAFKMGIIGTKNHQEIADELGHHIVEYRQESDNFPFLKASPSVKGKKTDFVKDDGYEFDTYCFKDKLPLRKPAKRPFYWYTRDFKHREAVNYKRRNQPKCMIDRMVLGLQPEFKRLK